MWFWCGIFFGMFAASPAAEPNVVAFGIGVALLAMIAVRSARA